jgi:hypothetical protein
VNEKGKMKKLRCPARTLENAQCRNSVGCRAELCGVHEARGFMIGDYYVRAVNGPVGVTLLKSQRKGEPDIVLFQDRHSLPLENCPDSVDIYSDEFLIALDSLPGPITLAFEAGLWDDATLKFWQQPAKRDKIVKFYKERRLHEGGPLARLDAKLRTCVLDHGCEFKNLRVVMSQIRQIAEALEGSQLTQYYWDYFILESLGFLSSPFTPWRAPDGGEEFQQRAALFRSILLQVAGGREAARGLLREVRDAVNDLVSLKPAKHALFPPGPHAKHSALCKELARVPAAERKEFEELLPRYVALEVSGIRPRPGFEPVAAAEIDLLFVKLNNFVQLDDPRLELSEPDYEFELDVASPVAMAYEDCYFILRSFGKHRDSKLVVGYFGADHVFHLASFFHNMRQSHRVDFQEHRPETRCLAPDAMIGLETT